MIQHTRADGLIDTKDPDPVLRLHCDHCARWKRRSEFARNPHTLDVIQPCLTCRESLARDRRWVRAKHEDRVAPLGRLPMQPMQQLIQSVGGPSEAAKRIGVSMETLRQAARRDTIQVGTADTWATALDMPLSLLYPDLY